MSDANIIKEYFKKTLRIVNYEADFKLFNSMIIRKGKLDDILCCIIASLPETYKRFIKAEYDKKLPSVNLFRILYKDLRQKFFFSHDYYIVNANKIHSLINSINSTLEIDMQYAEKNIPSK